MDLTAFAAEVGSDDPVTIVGGGTQWDVGGGVDPSARRVCAPAGVAAYDPAEMTVRCGAGTTVAELDGVLAEHGQTVALPDWHGATVGGVLAVGRSGTKRLGYGPVRDVLLEARYVSAAGTVVKAGGPTVKNVSGFDLCRMLVGSLGTLGFLAEAVLRVRPLPIASQWFTTGADPFALFQRLHHPTSLLWDGTTSWVLLEGHPDDIDEQSKTHALQVAGGPPSLPSGRRSLRPSALPSLAGTTGFVAEIGVGVVHTDAQLDDQGAQPDRIDLHHRLKAAFDPNGRLNPGRRVA
jgi:FAD/FMN-containing dehydrogenase